MLETKMLIALLAEAAAKAKTAKEVYNSIAVAANVEGLNLPTYEEYQKTLEEKSK
ncbi:MAG: hypothetical protein FWD48_09990 [Oscillospiraceae bacterium]|nr:hypothetical protein [Oscillospiraceae bacterium]